MRASRAARRPCFTDAAGAATWPGLRDGRKGRQGGCAAWETSCCGVAAFARAAWSAGPTTRGAPRSDPSEQMGESSERLPVARDMITPWRPSVILVPFQTSPRGNGADGGGLTADWRKRAKTALLCPVTAARHRLSLSRDRARMFGRPGGVWPAQNDGPGDSIACTTSDSVWHAHRGLSRSALEGAGAWITGRRGGAQRVPPSRTERRAARWGIAHETARRHSLSRSRRARTRRCLALRGQ